MKDQFQGDRIDLDQALGAWLYRVNQGLRRLLFRTFREAGHALTPEQWMTLVRLWDQDGVLQNDLCERTLKDRPTMSRALEVLERRGLVVRRPDPVDLRGRRVFLTAEAKALERVLVPLARSVVERLEAGVSEADLRTTRRVLQQLARNLEAGEGR